MNNYERQRRCFLKSANDQFERGRLKRREFLQLRAQAGFAFGLYGVGMPLRSVLAAPTSENILQMIGPDSAIEPSGDQQKFLRDVGKTFAGTTLRPASKDTSPSATTRELMNTLVNRYWI